MNSDSLLSNLHTDKDRLIGKVTDHASIGENFVITSQQLSNGNYQVLSHYADMVWQFPVDMFSPGTRKNSASIDFSRLQNCNYVPPLKYSVALYFLKGLPGFRRPKGGTIVNFFRKIVPFLNYLSDHNIISLDIITPLVTSQYVDYCKSLPGRSRNSKTLAPNALAGRLRAIELLYSLLLESQYSFTHPWPNSSASALANVTYSKCSLTSGKTAIIPDEVLNIIMCRSVSLLDQADGLLAYSEIVSEAKNKGVDYYHIRRKLYAAGYSNTAKELAKELLNVLDACMLIILITTGIRIHELLSLETDCAYTQADEDGGIIYGIKGVSTKTHTGKTEWICPKLCHYAIKIAKRVTMPLRDKLMLQMDQSDSLELDNTKKHSNRLFIGCTYHQNSCVATLSCESVRLKLKKFVYNSDVNWDFSPHQCRRTFAVYVVRHVLGDLRYLREHFKHWSIDMTALYAANQSQDKDLYDEIYTAMIDEKRAKITHWLEPDTLVSGGMGESIKVFRSKNEPVRTYKNRAEMIDRVSDSISLRATGVAWCTAEASGCNGGTTFSKTKCADCTSSVIDDRQRPLWEAIYQQQIELINLDDIGHQGKETARLALKRCEQVLRDLGADVANIQKRVNNSG